MLTLPFIDEDFVHGSDKTGLIKDFLKEHRSEYQDSLIGDISRIHHRAQNLNGIEITDIEYQSGNEYCMSYTYDYFVYNGCSNMDHQDDEEGFVCFRINEDGAIEFDTPNFEERSTYNEF